MTVSSSALIDNLIAIKTHYEQELIQVEMQATHQRKQLAHVNSLLLERMLPQAQRQLSSPPQEYPSVPPTPEPNILAIAPSTHQVPEPVSAAPATVTQPKRSVKTASQRLASPPLLEPYQGLTKLNAIRQVLENHGKTLHIDVINQALYGDLTPQQLLMERPRLRTFLHRGVQRKLWQKDPNSSSYFLHLTENGQPQDQAPPTEPPPALKAMKTRRKKRTTVTHVSAEVKQLGKPKTRQVELVALLKNADSLV